MGCAWLAIGPGITGLSVNSVTISQKNLSFLIIVKGLEGYFGTNVACNKATSALPRC
jgi:hypothetical protein